MELLKREYGLGADTGAGEDGGGYSVFSWLQFCKVKWNKILYLIRQFINIVSNIIWNGIKNLHIINIF